MLALEKVLADLAQGRCTGTVDLRPKGGKYGRKTLTRAATQAGDTSSSDALTDGNIAPLVKALETARFTGELNLAGNQITEQGLLHLTKVLAPEDGGPGCCSLILSGNPIASRGGKALAAVIRRSPNLKKLDISGTDVSDDGVGFICQAMIATDTIEEMKVGKIGAHGLQYMQKVLQSCPSLRVFHAEVVEVATLTKAKATLSDADYDYSGHAPPPAADDAEEPGEEEKAKLDAKKAEQLKRLTENHYDSDDEEVDLKRGSAILPASTEAPEAAVPDEPSAGKSEAAMEVEVLLGGILDTFVATPHLLDVTLEGEPAYAIEEELSMIREERAHDEEATVLQPWSAPGVEALLEAQGKELGGEDPYGLSALPVRGYFNRKASAALSEALFECQRYKSQQNAAVMDDKGEMAFVAMYLRRYLTTHKEG